MTTRNGVFGLIFALGGALLALPFAASRYEQANALSCCENPGGDGLLVGGIIIPIAVVLLWPLMACLSGRLLRLAALFRALALVFFGAPLGALLGWALFQFLLLPSEIDGATFGTWGIAPGALVGAAAAIGWWFGSDMLARFKKVKNG